MTAQNYMLGNYIVTGTNVNSMEILDSLVIISLFDCWAFDCLNLDYFDVTWCNCQNNHSSTVTAGMLASSYCCNKLSCQSYDTAVCFHLSHSLLLAHLASKCCVKHRLQKYKQALWGTYHNKILWNPIFSIASKHVFIWCVFAFGATSANDVRVRFVKSPSKCVGLMGSCCVCVCVCVCCPLHWINLPSKKSNTTQGLIQIIPDEKPKFIWWQPTTY